MRAEEKEREDMMKKLTMNLVIENNWVGALFVHFGTWKEEDVWCLNEKA